VLGKSLRDGVPLTAVVASRGIFERVFAGGVGGTYGGNAVACAAGRAVLDTFDSEPLLERAQTIAVQVREALGALALLLPEVGDVRGLGCMLGSSSWPTGRRSRQLRNLSSVSSSGLERAV